MYEVFRSVNEKLLTGGGGHDVLLKPSTAKNGPITIGSRSISHIVMCQSIPVDFMYLPIDNPLIKKRP